MSHLTVGLESLPVELLYEVQLSALSHTLPHTSTHLHAVYKRAPPSFHAQYILGRVLRNQQKDRDILTKALRYPLCSKDVLDAISRSLVHPSLTSPTIEIPRRVFRSLSPKTGQNEQWTDQDHPLPFVRHLYDCPDIPSPDPNSHDGYALTRAVHAGFHQLIQFLLDRGASPRLKNGLPVMVAIRRKDLLAVRMLIERDGSAGNHGWGKKRRRLEDRIQVHPGMLKAAVKCEARDIMEYLVQEKGCIPDMQTLHMMTGQDFFGGRSRPIM